MWRTACGAGAAPASEPSDDLAGDIPATLRGSPFPGRFSCFHRSAYLLMGPPIQAAVAVASCGRQRRRPHCWRLYVRHAQRASPVALTRPRTRNRRRPVQISWRSWRIVGLRPLLCGKALPFPGVSTFEGRYGCELLHLLRSPACSFPDTHRGRGFRTQTVALSS